MKCVRCSKKIIPGNTNGFPNGVGLLMRDGNTINVCYKCICDIGEMTDEKRNEFFKSIGVDNTFRQ